MARVSQPHERASGDANLIAALAEASRAPSVHNIQPARWRFSDDDRVWLFEDTRRRLAIGDPLGRDNAASLGAAFEGLHLALSRRGQALATPELVGPAGEPAPAHLHLYATSRIIPAAKRDALADYVNERSTYRDVFEHVDRVARVSLLRRLHSLGDLVLVAEEADLREIARLNDDYSYQALTRPAYQAELYHWMRFRKRDPAWGRDGLNAECMALNGVERIAAAALLQPTVFRLLTHAGLGKLLVAESRKTESAAAIGLFIVDLQQHPFDSGRRFYRVWLEICRAGYSLCPMSVLSDSDECARHLRERWSIGNDKRLVNVFRIGKPAYQPARSPRLPVHELLV